MTDAVQRMLEQIEPGARPPIHNWQPSLSGVIDIRIDRDGHWYHEGEEIKRFELVKLFASILRYELDNGHVLVTPVEKWQIEVEDAPFIAVAMARRFSGNEQQIALVTNVGEEVLAGTAHPIFLQEKAGIKAPYIAVRDGLTAKLSRPVYYEMAEFVEQHNGETGIRSAGVFFPLD